MGTQLKNGNGDNLFPNVYFGDVSYGGYSGTDILEKYIPMIVENVSDASSSIYSGPLFVMNPGDPSLNGKVCYADRTGVGTDSSLFYFSMTNGYVGFDSSWFSYGNYGKVIPNFKSGEFSYDSEVGKMEFENFETVHGITNVGGSDTSVGRYASVAAMKSAIPETKYMLFATEGKKFCYCKSDEIVDPAVDPVIRVYSSKDVSGGDTDKKFYILGTTSAITGTEGSDVSAYSMYDSVNSKSVYVKNYTIYQSSDERLKDIEGDIEVSADDISKIRKIRYIWNCNPFGSKEIGVTAQSVAEVFPELVSENEGILSVSYDRLSVIALSAIDSMSRKIDALEKRIDALESVLNINCYTDGSEG